MTPEINQVVDLYKGELKQVIFMKTDSEEHGCCSDCGCSLSKHDTGGMCSGCKWQRHGDQVTFSDL